MDQVPAQVALPIGDRSLGQRGGEALEEIGVRQVELAEGGAAGVGEVPLPIDAGHEFPDPGDRHLVVAPVGVAQVDPAQRALGQGGLELQHRGGPGLGDLGGVAQELQHAGDMGGVLPAQLPGLRVVPEIVVALGQAEPALPQLGDFPAAVAVVRAAPELESRGHSQALQARDLAQHVSRSLEGVDPVEFEPQRSDAGRADRGPVHAAGEEVAHHLLDRRTLVVQGAGALAEQVQVLLIALQEFVEGGPAGIRRGNRRPRDPSSVDVAVEIVLRLDRRIEVLGQERGAGRDCGREPGGDQCLLNHHGLCWKSSRPLRDAGSSRRRRA